MVSYLKKSMLFSDAYSASTVLAMNVGDFKELAQPENHQPTGEKLTKMQTHIVYLNCTSILNLTEV